MLRWKSKCLAGIDVMYADTLKPGNTAITYRIVSIFGYAFINSSKNIQCQWKPYVQVFAVLHVISRRQLSKSKVNFGLVEVCQAWLQVVHISYVQIGSLQTLAFTMWFSLSPGMKSRRKMEAYWRSSQAGSISICFEVSIIDHMNESTQISVLCC